MPGLALGVARQQGFGDSLADRGKDSCRLALVLPAVLAGEHSVDRELLPGCRAPLVSQGIPVLETGRGIGDFRA